MARDILHVDMDAFYAAIEQRERPELLGKPVIVGADPKGGRGRGVVSTASYEARKYGVRSAMPISRAYALCPEGVYVPVDMELYSRVSSEIMKILRDFTDKVEPVSIDEAFLDLTQGRRLMGPAPEVASKIKESIVQGTSLTASIGVASSKLVAKIASDFRKPDGLTIVPPGEEAAFLAPLAVRRLWGIGPKMEERLAQLGIQTIGDLARVDPSRLEHRVGSHGHDLITLARGIDERPVIAEAAEAKSLGQERTFLEDTHDLERLRRTLLGLADGVGERLRSYGLRAHTITLKYRDETYRTLTRAETLEEPTDSGNALFEVAWRLFEGVHGPRRVRLVGLYASGFGKDTQLPLFPKEPSAADRVRDTVSERFGNDALTRASLLRKRRPKKSESQ